MNRREALPWLSWLVLSVLCATVFLTSFNHEFYRDEDPELLYHTASFARLLTLQEAEHSVLYQAMLFLHSAFFYRHGALPGFYNGLILGVFDVLGVPMTVRVYQLPTALIAIATVLLFHAVLLRAGVARGLALAGAALLALSPLLAALGRGIHTYVWVWIAFGHVLGLFAMQAFRNGCGRWLLGFAFTNILLGDGLFFLSIGALAAAYALAEVPLARPFDGAREGLRAVFGRLCALIRWQVVLPPAIALLGLMVSAAATLAFRNSSIATAIPFHSLLLAALPHLPSGEAVAGHWNGWGVAVVGLGEGGPVLLALAVAGFLFRSRVKGMEWWFAVIGSIGFGILIYGMAPTTHYGTIECYQIYTLVPFLTLIVLQANRLLTMAPVLCRGTMAVLAVGIVLSGTSMSTYVWHAPLAFRPQDFADGDMGSNKPVFGTKAAGFLTRQALVPAIRDGADNITATIFQDGKGPTKQALFGGFRNWYAPYILFAGLAQNGDWYARAAGRDISLNRDIRLDPVKPSDGLPDCDADLCAVICVGKRGESRAYLVEDGDRKLARMWITGVSAAAPRSGAYRADDLGRAFEREYARITDLFPSRPKDRVAGILAQVHRRLGI